ncbi:MAG: tubulin-like doman-containing protein [Nostoc sp. DedQUE08]|uniref:tubulin-like doman-containing protein n=1 Tax=unclassified Nostoc TaxID=2593658 RepID=UPI002AD25DBB|nr:MULTISPECIES: tubulin-like doman-containing protein [unclassified Nostoc]MDZ8064769.1 tubulin-like doman-containing protein [Nostoc sp. DedQUE08]MDZ8093684.1 tubulin-like doman-containing protein [Nostoc sp. DedQUE05]MDZ8128600.1 tubulin-like doman-containing protein [Nostoc sp. DedQUE07]
MLSPTVVRPTVVFRPTVVIGLGGTGYEVVLKLKKRFIDIYGSVPEVIRFISIDTTENIQEREKSPDGTKVILEPNELYAISVANPLPLTRNDHIAEWWPRDISAASLISGAGQIRARGRLALFAKVGDIDALIAQAINTVREIRTSKQAFSENFQVSSRDGVEVFIVGSLAGGTGSGTFLDTAFLTREHLNNFSNITGVFVLPRVFANIPQTHLVKSNAYGALKEIEHFWGLSPSNSIEIDYGTKKIKADRPPFDAVFLIDGVNKNGTVVGRPDDLQNLVADGLYIQIGSQIGLDAANVADNIRAYLATGEKVRGRNINYCSFGFATLTLPVQQYERMKLEDAQSLLKNELMASTATIDLESDITRFLEDCKLAEATTLLNALTESDRGGQMKPEFRIGEIRQDRTALPTIKELYKRQLDQFEQRTAQELGLSFYRLEQTASAAIATFWERGLNRPNGLAYVLEFLSKLSQKLDELQQSVQQKSQEAQSSFNALKLEAQEEKIKEAAETWFPNKNTIQAACQRYKERADQKWKTYLHWKRCDKAAELYGVLRAKVEQIQEKCQRLHSNLDKVYRDIEQSYHEVNRQGSNDNPFIHTIQRINIQSKRPKVTGEDFIRWHREQSQTLTNWSEKKAEDVKNEILKFVNEAYYPLTSMTVEQVLADSNPEDAGQDLQQLGKLAVPLWQYEVSEIPIQQQHLITEFYYYGVESNNTIFSDPPLSNRLPKGNNNPSFVPTGEPHKVMLFRVEVGVPLFAFNGMRELESAYLDPNKVFKHLHRNWTNLANLIPPEDDGGALRWFALALAPDPYKLVVNQSKKYFVSTEQAKRLEGGVLPLGGDRKSAFKAFKSNLPLVKEIANKVEQITHEDQDKAKSTLQNYINHLNQVLKGGKVDAQIQEQVEMEIQEIEAYLEDLDVII